MRVIKNLFLTCLLMFISLVTYAQVTTSAISGTVTDNNGPVVGAVVKAVSNSSIQYYTVVDNRGQYKITNMRAGGPYVVEVQMIGYSTCRLEDVYLDLSDEKELDFVLEEEVTSLNEVVIAAEATTSNMSTSRAGSVTTVSSKMISALPTVSRSMNDMMRLTPQAAVTSNGFAVGGGNYRQSYVTVDGAAFNNMFGIGSNLPAGGTPISLDALEQMNISLTPYDVRYSGFVGGAINAVTKSGDNKFRVTVYDYYTSQYLQGKKYGSEGNTLTLSEKLQNTTGASVSGPIVKDKLFFFVNFEYDIDNNPGQSRLARNSRSDEWGKSTQYNRPVVSEMDNIAKYLKDKYDYDPGEYQGYSFNTPDWKVFARLDWNINRNNHFNIRYSRTSNKYMTSPSSSVSPFGSTALYNRNSYGRVSNYSLYFKNANYYQEQNFSSIAAELNTHFADGRGSNILRGTFSHQYEPRSYNGKLFPTVDILEPAEDGTRAVYTTFGIDPFTYGNVRDVTTWNVSDEFSYNFGRNSLLAGLQFDYTTAKNGYMQMGAGYFLYESWQDFINNDKAPAAFAITHGNNDDLEQQFPYLTSYKASAYIQDEFRPSERFKLTAGVRFELPIYPSMDFNENKDFTRIYANTTGWKTSDVPNTYVSVSPRIGFNWDITGYKTIVLRGGTGIYTGSLPMVWLVSSVGNSNVMQSQVIWSGSGVSQNMRFPETAGQDGYISDILTMVYGGTFKKQDLPAPTATTILDKNLKLPTTWKSSLALDFLLPGDVVASVEGIYNKDLHSVVVTKEGMISNPMTLAGEPSERVKFTNDPNCKNFDGKNINPYWIHNSDLNGYYYSVTAKLYKKFYDNLFATVSYTRSDSKTLNDGLGDQVTSVFSTNTYAKNGSNVPELGHSSYVAPNRVLASVSYKINEGKHAATVLSAFYEGTNHGYVGNQYSYTRWTYTFNSCLTGEGGAYNTIYIPTESELAKMQFVSDENRVAFNERIMSDKYLSTRRGQYAERGSQVMPWHNQLDLKVEQDIFFTQKDGRKHNIVVGLDIKNALNLVNPKWGNFKTLNNQELLKYNNGIYTYNADACTYSTLASTVSTWAMLLSLRYKF